MYFVTHKRYRSFPRGDWIREESFRYWPDRRGVLKQRGILIHEETRETSTFRMRFEIWRSQEDFEQFRDDICARVIDSVVRHEESISGITHETICSGE